MRYYGINVSHEELRYILKTNNDGSSAYDIISGSRLFGFDGYGIHYTYEDIINGKVSLPIICHTIKNNYYHFIVVYKINKKNILVMDPSSNIYKISYEYFKSIYLNTSIVIYPVKEIKNSFKYIDLFSYIIDYLKNESKTFFKIIMYSIIVIIINIIVNYYLVICLDKIIPNYRYDIFLYLTIIFMNLYLIKNILDYIKNKYLIILENNIYSKLNINIIRKIFNLPYLFFKSFSTGEVMSRINDLEVLKNYISNIFVNSILNILFIIFSSIILININLKLFIILFIVIFIYYVIVLLMKNNYVLKNEKLIESYSYYNKVLNDSIYSYEIDNNLNLILNSIKRLEFSFNKYLFKNKDLEVFLNNQSIIKNIIIDIGYILSIFMSIIYLNKNIISIGELFLFNSIIFYFIEPFKNIIDLNYKFHYIKNILNRISDLLMIKSELNSTSNSKLIGDIHINNLSYKLDNFELNNINIYINYGTKFLVYGSSGSGKSTIIKIILKYLNDYEGSVYINNINIKDIDKGIIHNSFTYVSQNSYLINDTLKNNIIYDRSISDLEYEQVINICNLNSFRDSKNNRNSFMIEDNGFNISGGQKQKIILARSLLKDSNYIILDEALSEVSNDEEKEIIKKLFDIYSDKTIIYITHKKEIIDLFENKYHLERREVSD